MLTALIIIAVNIYVKENFMFAIRLAAMYNRNIHLAIKKE